MHFEFSSICPDFFGLNSAQEQLFPFLPVQGIDDRISGEKWGDVGRCFPYFEICPGNRIITCHLICPQRSKFPVIMRATVTQNPCPNYLALAYLFNLPVNF